MKLAAPRTAGVELIAEQNIAGSTSIRTKLLEWAAGSAAESLLLPAEVAIAAATVALSAALADAAAAGAF
jgi:hypothetical protein